ncbi:MAG: bifunctional DNA-formamidopyrimidine glycosylase/DNA-(apurinic or apyrimidinic site) lyase [Actinomycetota bacterium]|nr:bifunctional DNA-formamidopyrimidine glycosylase/DNA-(apurinic or apyrimidinic site) lyase [Actinomycetota bacterium]
MPELPEVEVVRAGLAREVVGREIGTVTVRHPRSIRRFLGGAEQFEHALIGRTIRGAHRRGKYLWLPLSDGQVLLGHLGMSGQLLVEAPSLPENPHLRVVIGFTDPGRDLHFVDQRTFGGLWVEPAGPGSEQLPASLTHIARDPLDPLFDERVFISRLRRRRTEIKRALLDQTLISGVGNIYADEALWRVGLHGGRATSRLPVAKASELVGAIREVMIEALASGGTSFDSLYVNVNGDSGYFSRSLNAYGRTDLPCLRCGTPMRREAFMNRSSFSCPVCQPRPRRRNAVRIPRR